jgi:hypothetical protein
MEEFKKLFSNMTIYKFLSMIFGSILIAVVPPIGMIMILYCEKFLNLKNPEYKWFDKERFWKSFFLFCN